MNASIFSPLLNKVFLASLLLLSVSMKQAAIKLIRQMPAATQPGPDIPRNAACSYLHLLWMPAVIDCAIDDNTGISEGVVDIDYH